MNVLVTGSGGQLAWELTRSKPEHVQVVALTSSELDITKSEQVHSVVSAHEPAIIINAAAYTAVDKAEEEQESAYSVNATGAENLAKVAALKNIRLLHVSTDFVFDGTKVTPYTPQDKPNPLSVYGASKLKGDQLVLSAKPDSVIVRTAWVYSSHGNNFVKTMLRLMAEKDELGIVCDQVGTPTYARNLASWLWAIVEKPEVSGIFHWTDAGVASWYDFAVAIQEISLGLGLLENEISIKPLPTSAYPTPAKRPPFSVLDKSAAEEVSGIQCTHWRSALKEMLVNVKADKEKD